MNSNWHLELFLWVSVCACVRALVVKITQQRSLTAQNKKERNQIRERRVESAHSNRGYLDLSNVRKHTGGTAETVGERHPGDTLRANRCATVSSAHAQVRLLALVYAEGEEEGGEWHLPRAAIAPVNTHLHRWRGKRRQGLDYRDCEFRAQNVGRVNVGEADHLV